MNRRAVDTPISRRAACGAVAALLTPVSSALAQPRERKVLIGFLGGTVASSGTRDQTGSLRQGLRELGYVEGQHFAIEARWAEGKPERLPALLTELMALAPAILVTAGPRPAMLARDATSSIPIVAVATEDPVATGLAASLARPGRNITGLTTPDGILERRLQLLKDIVPTAQRFGVLMNPFTLARPFLDNGLKEMERTLAVRLVAFEARGPEDFDAAFAAMVRERVDGVAVLADATFFANRARLGELCLKHRLPSVWGDGSYLDAGGLVSYQGDFPAMFRRSASMVDKILKGTKPGEIPFEQSTKFVLVVNQKGARAIGVKIPASVLIGADEVIE